jgi:hypothetical protein
MDQPVKFPHIKFYKSKHGEDLWNFNILDPDNDYKVIAGFTGQTWEKAHEMARKKAHEIYDRRVAERNKLLIELNR